MSENQETLKLYNNPVFILIFDVQREKFPSKPEETEMMSEKFSVYQVQGAFALA